jgi:hypothetical protein
MQFSIDFNGNAKVFDVDFEITSKDFYSLEIHPFIGKKGLDSFELLFSNIVSGEVTWDDAKIDKSRDSGFGKLIIKGKFEQNLNSQELIDALSNPLTSEAIEFKSTTVFILIDPSAKEEWDRTKGLALKETGGFQKIKMSISN